MIHEFCLLIRDVHTTRHATILFCRFAGQERAYQWFVYCYVIFNIEDSSMILDAYCELWMSLTKEQIEPTSALFDKKCQIMNIK
jgi:hypothetical protein